MVRQTNYLLRYLLLSLLTETKLKWLFLYFIFSLVSSHCHKKIPGTKKGNANTITLELPFQLDYIM